MYVLINLFMTHDYYVVVFRVEDKLARPHQIMAKNVCHTSQYCNMQENILQVEHSEEYITVTFAFEHIGCNDACIPMWTRC